MHYYVIETMGNTLEQDGTVQSVPGMPAPRQSRAAEPPSDLQADQDLDTMVELGYD